MLIRYVYIILWIGCFGMEMAMSFDDSPAPIAPQRYDDLDDLSLQTFTPLDFPEKEFLEDLDEWERNVNDDEEVVKTVKHEGRDKKRDGVKSRSFFSGNTKNVKGKEGAKKKITKKRNRQIVKRRRAVQRRGHFRTKSTMHRTIKKNSVERSLVKNSVRRSAVKGRPIVKDRSMPRQSVSAVKRRLMKVESIDSRSTGQPLKKRKRLVRKSSVKKKKSRRQAIRHSAASRSKSVSVRKRGGSVDRGDRRPASLGVPVVIQKPELFKKSKKKRTSP